MSMPMKSHFIEPYRADEMCSVFKKRKGITMLKKIFLVLLCIAMICGAVVACTDDTQTADTQGESQIQTEVATKVETDVQTQTETKAQTEATTQVETQVTTQAETQAETEEQTQAQSTYTVTKEQFDAAFLLDNVTVNGYLTENGEQEPVMFKVTSTMYYSENDGYVAYAIKLGDDWYMYEENRACGQLVQGFASNVGMTVRSFHLPAYEAFTYDEAKQAYTCTVEDIPVYKYAALSFVDGKLVKFEAGESAEKITYSFVYSDYGTTVAPQV